MGAVSVRDYEKERETHPLLERERTMGSRMPSHQLPSGLVVSGRPDKQPKDRGPTMGSRAVPYTGGDVKKSGELGKMFDIDPAASASASAAVPRTPRSASSSGSGQFKPPPGSGSGSIPKRTPSGQLLPATGLITSGPVPSTPTASMRRSESLEPKAAAYPAAVTSLGSDSKAFRARVPWVISCSGVLVVVIGVGVGIFVLVAMKNVVVVAAAGGVSVVVVAVAAWNWGKGRRAKELERFVAGFPDAELRGAKHGEFVKVTGRK
ncbi:putative membrane protein [Acorus calamus]|uniref:Membrane protein n=1 Tax=Acorus calamus TaxID=4465 RepID=A0AAV9CTU6_ACOCL|nr:putative membrane protein [Acorus calamus]